MNIRDQLAVLLQENAEFVVIGGQAGVLRQAFEFSHDLDVLIRATPENAECVRRSVARIAGVAPDLGLVLGRDFQQYIDDATGTEIDVHLKLIAIPDFEAGRRNASEVDFLGIKVCVLELPALYASKRTDRPRDALHRRAIEDRLRRLVLDDLIEIDEIVLACCLDPDVARSHRVMLLLPDLARSTRQPLLQVRLLATGLHGDVLVQNPALHATVMSLLSLDVAARAKLLAHPARLAALLARVPLVLPEAGYRIQYLATTR